jgi:hypothetical protein
LPRWLDKLLTPDRPALDPGKPIGAFKLCDRGEHVVEFWAARCEACDRPGALPVAEPPARELPPPLEPPPFAPPITPPPLSDLPPPSANLSQTRFVRVGEQQRPDSPDPSALQPSKTVFSRRRAVRRPPPHSLPPERELRGPSRAWGRLHLTFELSEPSCAIGSDPRAQVHILGDQVGAHHATISLQGGSVVLTPTPGVGPVQITNRVQEQWVAQGTLAIEDGDLIWVGSVKLRFERIR